MTRYRVAVDSPTRPDVAALVDEHLVDMHATSPVCSVHALGGAQLDDERITFVTARTPDDTLLGCGALKEIDARHGELKSMRTTASARGRGVASAILEYLTSMAVERSYSRLSLETGTQDYFAPARSFYSRHGFTPTEPFADYVEDPNSTFMTRQI